MKNGYLYSKLGKCMSGSEIKIALDCKAETNEHTLLPIKKVVVKK